MKGRQKAGFLSLISFKNHSNEGKGKKKKKERGEGKEEKRKKQWLRSLVFIMATLVRHTCLPIYLLFYLNFAFETPSIGNENCLSSKLIKDFYSHFCTARVV